MSQINLIENLKQNIFNKIKKAFDLQDFLSVVNLSPQYMDRDKSNPWVHCYFGYALYMLYGIEAKLASQYMQNAIKLNPNIPELYIYLANALRDRAQPVKSLNLYHKALELDPENHFAIYNLGVTHVTLGDIEDGMDLIMLAATKSNNLKYMEDLLYFIYHDPRFKNPDYYKLSKLFYQIAKEKHPIKPFIYNDSRYEKNKSLLRIGFFNAETLDTPTWAFLEKVFQKLSKEKFEIYCYLRPPNQILWSETGELHRISQSADKWIYCNGLSVKDTAALIHSDEIDILIDLSGYASSIAGHYSVEPNMLVFMHKPAPVQIEWYGFWGTTGIPEIDYLITTEDNLPKSQDQYFTEKIYRLTNGYTHSELCSDLPEIVAEPPCIKNNYITFSSFSRAMKLNSRAYDVWSEILKRVPSSKLLIKNYLPSVERIKDNFSRRGIDADRIIIEPKSQPRKEFIATYNKVDIALEPVPFGGITTTINALSMGVPVIAEYEEDRTVNGGSTSLLKSIGLANLATTSDEEYINQAVKLAGDIDLLKTYRKTLRDRMLNSSINAENYTKDLEKAFMNIWQACCERENNRINTVSQ